MDDKTDMKQRDLQFESNVSGCENADIPYGIYHYSYAASREDAAQEASYLLSALGDAAPSLPVFYDMEDSALPCSDVAAMGDIASAFCSAISAEGLVPGVYASLSWWNSYLTDSRFSSWPRWVAQWGPACTYEGSYEYWQCSSAGAVDGIDAAVDIDFMMASSSIPMHRLYNPYSGEHLYTESTDERDLLTAIGWNDEGIGWNAPSAGADVYRLYNPWSGDHHYTMGRSECRSLEATGWEGEGVCWHSAPTGLGVPVYRQFNPYAVVAMHNYTTSEEERDHLVALGWRDEGIAWYGV